MARISRFASGKGEAALLGVRGDCVSQPRVGYNSLFGETRRRPERWHDPCNRASPEAAGDYLSISSGTELLGVRNRVGRGLHLVPVESCRQRTHSIGQ
jgi:hypothetical protein